MKFGFTNEEWATAKAEAIAAIVSRAKRRDVVFYSDLVKEISTIAFEPRDPRLATLLGEISEEEDGAGRGMLSALVVLKDSYQPGHGFFELAKGMGKNLSDPDAFLIAETNRVYAQWNPQR